MAGVAQPDTILAWYHRLIARKFDGSKRRSYRGRPPIDAETEALIVRMARENSGWGYDRIVGALANLGHGVSDQTLANVLRRYGIAPAPKRCQKTTWKEFISAHLAVLAGADFLTVEYRCQTPETVAKRPFPSSCGSPRCHPRRNRARFVLVSA